MRVLIAHKLWHVRGGVERYVINLQRMLTDRGHEAIPFTCRHEDNLETGYEQYYPPYRDLGRVRMGGDALLAASNILYSSEARRSLGRLLDEHGLPDVAHCRNIYHHLSPSILFELKARGVPVVMTVADYKLVCPAYTLFRDQQPCEACGGGRFWNAVRYRCVKDSIAASSLCTTEAYVHRWTGAYLSNIDQILTPSEFMRDQMIRLGLPGDRLSVVPHFVELDEWRSDASDATVSQRPYFVSFGRLSTEKGLATAIAALRDVPGAELHIAGEGPDRRRLEELAEQAAPGRVRMLGRLDGAALREAIAGSIASLMPSEWNEPFGFTVLESYALAKPVIGSRMGAIPELIDHGVTGLLFEAGNPEDLAESMRRLLDDQASTRDMGHNAQQLAQANYSASVHYERLMDIYSSVLR